MLEATSSNDENYKSTDDLDLEEILHSARDCLNCSRFDDAEAAFLKLYQQIQVCVALPRGAMGLSAVCDCGIS